MKSQVETSMKSQVETSMKSQVETSMKSSVVLFASVWKYCIIRKCMENFDEIFSNVLFASNGNIVLFTSVHK